MSANEQWQLSAKAAELYQRSPARYILGPWAFGDSSFDVVLCQQGLQFFPDRGLALREMRRVLRRGGRLALSDENNTGLYNSAVSMALGVYVGQDVAQRFGASRKAPSGEQLQRLVADAGLAAIELRIERMTIDLPPVETFVLDHLAATPVASDIAAAGPVARAEIGRSVKEQLHAYVRDKGVRFPEETHLLTARVP